MTMHPVTSGKPHLTLYRQAPEGLFTVAQEAGRLGVLGGAYNPITLAHLIMADTVRTAFELHEVLLLLPQVPPHKTIFGASLEQRLEMMQLAVREHPHLTVGLSSHGLFIDMYQALRDVYPRQTEVFFVTGRDAAERILTWDYDDTERTLRQMFSAFQLIACDREGPFRLPDDPRLRPHKDRIHRCTLPTDIEPISSTAVRQHCRAGRSVEELVPDAVATYIAQHDLYQEEAAEGQ